MENLAVNMENFRQKNVTRKFDVSEHENHYPNELTIKTIEDAEKGIGMSRTYDTVEELMRDLNDEAIS